jgi:hypothetical protein
VVDRGLGHHGVVLELRLPEGRSVGSDEDELRLASPEGLEGAAVAEDDLAGLDHKGELQNFIVSSHRSKGRDSGRELARTLAPMDCASFLFFLGAIATVF